jgi:hypothetical protein
MSEVIPLLPPCVYTACYGVTFTFICHEVSRKKNPLSSRYRSYIFISLLLFYHFLVLLVCFVLYNDRKLMILYSVDGTFIMEYGTLVE